jgi:serine/threonine protein kinase
MKPTPGPDIQQDPILGLDIFVLSSFINRGVYLSSGAFGDTYKSRFKGGGVAPILPRFRIAPPPNVAVKVIRIPALVSEEEKRKRFQCFEREVAVWGKLKHRNLLPLFGIAAFNGDANFPAFVSPWMEQGNVRDFLKRYPSFPEVHFLGDIIEGLYYLHTSNPKIVHGDIKGVSRQRFKYFDTSRHAYSPMC